MLPPAPTVYTSHDLNGQLIRQKVAIYCTWHQVDTHEAIQTLDITQLSTRFKVPNDALAVDRERRNTLILVNPAVT